MLSTQRRVATREDQPQSVVDDLTRSHIVTEHRPSRLVDLRRLTRREFAPSGRPAKLIDCTPPRRRDDPPGRIRRNSVGRPSPSGHHEGVLDFELKELVRAYIALSGSCTYCSNQGVAREFNQDREKLDELLAMGFRGKEASRVEEMVTALNKLEDETDELGLELSRRLFQHEDEIKPVSVIMWYQVIQWVGDLADYAEKVGDRLRLMIAR